MNKMIWILIILAVVIVALLAFLIFMPAKPRWKEGPLMPAPIEIFSPALNSEISFPLKITGRVNGYGWAGFEGQVGTVRILNSLGATKGSAVLTATSDWTKLPTDFEAIINPNFIGSDSASLLFANENPSGDPAKNKTFTLPVKIK
jgi:hypothetical protein